jgi:hypothetical protein
MLPKPWNQTIANRRWEVLSIAHRITGIGIDELQDSLLMLGLIQSRFDDRDLGHVSKPSR